MLLLQILIHHILLQRSPHFGQRPRQVILLHLDPFALELASSQAPPFGASDLGEAVRSVEVEEVLLNEGGGGVDGGVGDGDVGDVDPALQGERREREGTGGEGSAGDREETSRRL
jgi:hypothetical protein